MWATSFSLQRMLSIFQKKVKSLSKGAFEKILRKCLHLKSIPVVFGNVNFLNPI